MKEFNLLNDIYYSKEYASLYLKTGKSIFFFEYQEGADRFVNIAIKRPIDKIGSVSISDGYFDLETAYGYAGYYATTDRQDFLCRAFEAYNQKCLNEKIIAEFIRFHPYNTFPSVNKEYLEFLALDRQTVSIDLAIQKEARWSKYSSTTRNILRKAVPNLFFRETDDIDTFMRLYQATMKKNDANYFYYFSREYYEKLLAMKNVKLFAVEYDNHVINMSFVLLGKNLAHYHLSANNINFSKLNGNYYLLDSVCDYLKQHHPDVSHFHLGGGRSNLANDSLLAFKSKFSDLRNNFYIAGKIFNQTVYQQYMEIFHASHPEQRDTKFFLKYRMEEA